MSYNPSDIARLGRNFQVQIKHGTSGTTLVACRLQRAEPTRRQTTEIYHELGNIDPTGATSEAPEFTVVLNEYVHDSSVDLLLAGKNPASDTTWNLGDYLNNGVLTTYIVERDNSNPAVVTGEMEFNTGVLADIQWQWQMGQPISATYTMQMAKGKRWSHGSEVHGSWGTQETTSPGGIRIKDARLFLNGSADGNRVYRLQSFTCRVTWRTTPVREAGNRALVGHIVEPPDTTLDFDLLAADGQPDDVLFPLVSSGGDYYDYVNQNALTNSVIRIYDPDQAEASTILRSWTFEHLVLGPQVSPLMAAVRGQATKRYATLLDKVTTPGTGGLLLAKAA